MGEWAFPLLVLLGGAAVALVLILQKRGARASGAARSDAIAPPASRSALTRVALGLGAFVALLDVLGFVVAGAALFACAASGSGSRRWVRDVFAGFALSAVVYTLFVYGLGVSLPAGLAFN